MRIVVAVILAALGLGAMTLFATQRADWTFLLFGVVFLCAAAAITLVRGHSREERELFVPTDTPEQYGAPAKGPPGEDPTEPGRMKRGAP